MQTVPVYFISGFLDSGKTTFIRETLEDTYFCNGEKIVLIRCEEGEEEYPASLIQKKNITVVDVESEDKFTAALLKQCQTDYNPEKVIIEFNGTWNVTNFMERGLPKVWEMAQIISVVDSSTFDMYMSNMRQMMNEQFKYSELVIFNRCNGETKRNALRKAVKAVNRAAQVVYDFVDGSEGLDDQIDLPYDMNAEIIDIEDDDYGIFYLDAADDPQKYVGKTVRFTAMLYKQKNFPEGTFVPGRMAMTCCANDVAFVGFLCKGDQAKYYKSREWVKITAEIKCEYYKEYKGEGPVLYLKKIEPAKEPEEKLVYMN